MKNLDLLAPLHLLDQWRSEGISPQEIRILSDQWINEYRHLYKPPSKNNFQVPVRQGPKPHNPRPSLANQSRQCRHCQIFYPISEGYLKPRDFVCKFCKAQPRPPAGKRGPKPGKTLAKIEAIGSEIIEQSIRETGLLKTAKLYRFNPITLRKYFPDTHFENRKLPDDKTLYELGQKYTQAEIARMFDCSRERVRQRFLRMGQKAISPVDLKIEKLGGIEILQKRVWQVGIYKTSRENHLSYLILKRLFPDAPDFRGKNHQQPRRKLPGKEELTRLYQTHTAKEIALMFNTTPGTVRGAIYRWKLPLKKDVAPSLDELKAGVLALAQKLGHMPRIRDFREQGQAKLLYQVAARMSPGEMANLLGLKPNIVRQAHYRVLPPPAEVAKLRGTMTVKEIAAKYGVKVVSVYNKLARARE